MDTIKFSELRVTRSRIDLKVEYTEAYDLWFEFDRAVPVHPDQVALALSTLCGTAYKCVEFDFNVSHRASALIEDFTGAEIMVPHIGSPIPETPRSGSVLSFSGGFDSLSAKLLMPDDTHLVSLDFGGWFTREREFFEKFPTLHVKTNVRSEPSRRTPLTRNHWSFMAIGAILTAEYFRSRYHSFGSILGESLRRVGGGTQTLRHLEVLGMTEAGYTKGLTEVGTVDVIAKRNPEVLGQSLRSLAGTKDRKYSRKTALTSFVAEQRGLSIELPPEPSEHTRQIQFGEDYATSLAMLYLYAKGVGDLLSPLFEALPHATLKQVDDLSLNFMEKVNWDAYQSLPASIYSELSEKFTSLALYPYTEADWDEVKIVRQLLNDAYNGLRQQDS